MTFEQYMRKNLESCGMFDSQIDAVMLAVKDAPENESMLNRWHDDIADYPEVMTALVLMAVKRQALAWIDENMPLAWFRPMFE